MADKIRLGSPLRTHRRGREVTCTVGDRRYIQARSDGRRTSGRPPTQVVKAQVVKAEDVEWLLTHLRAVVAASPPAVQESGRSAVRDHPALRQQRPGLLFR